MLSEPPVTVRWSVSPVYAQESHLSVVTKHIDEFIPVHLKDMIR